MESKDIENSWLRCICIQNIKKGTRIIDILVKRFQKKKEIKDQTEE